MSKQDTPSPGEWKTVPYLHRGEPTGYLCIQFGEEEETISQALHPADARLMAASPQLLEACKAILEAEQIGIHLDRSGGTRSSLSDWKIKQDAAFRLLRAAIAKAEGAD